MNEAYHRMMATKKLNISLARLIGDPITTRYSWQLVSVITEHLVSWREFHRGEVGKPFPISRWAFTTVNVDGRQLLIGGTIILTGNLLNSILWTIWDDLPTQHHDLYDAFVSKARGSYPYTYKVIGNKHIFRRYLLGLE